MTRPRSHRRVLYAVARSAALVSCALAGAARAAPAQVHGESVVITVERAAGERLTRGAAELVRRTLETRGERDVADVPALAEALNAEGTPFRPATPRAALVRKDADEILDAAAYGRDAEAISRGRILIDTQRAELAALGTSDDVARAIADTCLFVVRALVHQGDEAGASSQVRECARLVPDLAVSRDLHPADVLALYAGARSKGPLGKLTVTAAGAADARCLLRLQGRPIAELPATVDLVPGVYAVASECHKDVPGFVREVLVEAEKEQRLVTAPDVEAHVRARGAGLELTGVAATSDGNVPGIGEVFRWTRAEELWIVERQSGAVVVTRLVQGTKASALRGRVVDAPASSFESRLAEATASLACGGKCAEVPVDEAARSVESHPYGTLGLVSVVTGGAAVAASWITFARFASLDSKLGGLTYQSSNYEGELDTRNTFRTASLVTTTAGSVLVAAGLPAILPRANGIPLWAAGIGVGGAALAGVGAVVWSHNGKLESVNCPSGETCLRPSATVPLGPLLVTQGAALLSVPATYLLRQLSGTGATLDVQASSTGASFVYGAAL